MTAVPARAMDVERAHPARVARVAVSTNMVRQGFTGNSSAPLPLRTRPSRIRSSGSPVKHRRSLMARLLSAATLAVLACSGGKMDDASRGRVALLLPSADKSSLTAPAVYHARFET